MRDTMWQMSGMISITNGTNFNRNYFPPVTSSSAGSRQTGLVTIFLMWALSLLSTESLRKIKCLEDNTEKTLRSRSQIQWTINSYTMSIVPNITIYKTKTQYQPN